MSLRSIFCGRENEASAENAVRYRSDASKIRIKVFQGGLVSVQTGPFTSALIRSRNFFDSTGSTFPTIEFLNCEMARERNWGIKEIVDWALDSDIHIFTNHPHQGKTCL